jgi:hypothetical protein
MNEIIGIGLIFLASIILILTLKVISNPPKEVK